MVLIRAKIVKMCCNQEDCDCEKLMNSYREGEVCPECREGAMIDGLDLFFV